MPVWRRRESRGTRVYVTNAGSDSVSVLDTATNTVTTTVRVDSEPYAIAVIPRGLGYTWRTLPSNSVSVLDTTPTTVIAQFNLLPTYPLNVSVNGFGRRPRDLEPGWIICSVASCSANFVSGASITLTASPTSGSSFAGWGGACTGQGTNPSCTVTMNASQSVTATFNLPTYTMNVSKGGTGSGTVTSDVGGITCGATCSTTQLAPGTIVTLTATR